MPQLASFSRHHVTSYRSTRSKGSKESTPKALSNDNTPTPVHEYRMESRLLPGKGQVLERSSERSWEDRGSTGT